MSHDKNKSMDHLLTESHDRLVHKIQEKLYNIKEEIPFYYSERYIYGNPEFTVDENIQVSKSIDEALAKKLVSVAKPSMVGKGAETVYDKTIRDGLEIEASRIKFSQEWEKTMASNGDYLNKMCKAIAPLHTQISAKFYKLMIYPKGSFFKPHKDTQRDPKHFGSIVIGLRSAYKGGDFILSHGGRSLNFNWGNESYNVGNVAFYTDVEHEVKPVTEGYRMTLVYNLYYEGDPLPNTTSLKLADTVKLLFNNKQEAFPVYGLILEFKYGQGVVSPNILKGNDLNWYNEISPHYDTTLIPIFIDESGEGGFDDASGKPQSYVESCLKDGCDVSYTISQLPEKNVLCEFQRPNFSDLNSYKGDVYFLNVSRNEWEKEKPRSDDLSPTGNEGTEFHLQYATIALLFKPKGSKSSINFNPPKYNMKNLKTDLPKFKTDKKVKGFDPILDDPDLMEGDPWGWGGGGGDSDEENSDRMGMGGGFGFLFDLFRSRRRRGFGGFHSTPIPPDPAEEKAVGDWMIKNGYNCKKLKSGKPVPTTKELKGPLGAKGLTKGGTRNEMITRLYNSIAPTLKTTPEPTTTTTTTTSKTAPTPTTTAPKSTDTTSTTTTTASTEKTSTTPKSTTKKRKKNDKVEDDEYEEEEPSNKKKKK